MASKIQLNATLSNLSHIIANLHNQQPSTSSETTTKPISSPVRRSRRRAKVPGPDSAEIYLIFIMAYDRYVAICDPLHYQTILNRKHCLLLASGTWISGSLNSFVIITPVSHMSFCHSRTIHQFFCDAKALINISCAGSKDAYIVIYMELLTYGVFPVMFFLTSYVKIIRVILQIKSKEGRKKAFSTCSSHLTIVIMFYMTVLSVYMTPTSEYTDVLEPVFSVLYSVVTPMMNPLIYSLRNKDVKRALLRLLGRKKSIEQ
ncbi:olfactory receptor 2T1-like [Pseudophryne corroboree]|uniref:olfactory receptor 2T1-like n=1 Tax=Pseudophryne corroboree TaxID=495146 RepID=UPI003081CA43